MSWRNWTPVSSCLRPVKHLLTAKDNVTYAPSRVYWCIAAAQFVFNSAYALIHLNQPWDPIGYGTGMGLVLTAGGVGVWITRKTEPGQEEA